MVSKNGEADPWVESVSPMSDVGRTDVKTEVSHHTCHEAHKHKPAAVHVFAVIWAPLE